MTPITASADPDRQPAVATLQAPAFFDHGIPPAAAWTGRQILGTIVHQPDRKIVAWSKAQGRWTTFAPGLCLFCGRLISLYLTARGAGKPAMSP